MSLLRILLFFAISLVVACGPAAVPRNEAESNPSPSVELRNRYELYRILAPRGWAAAEGCDSLLFVSLQHVGLGEPGPVELAQSGSGRWFRLPSPDFSAGCPSDISRDMFLGLFTYIWEFRRLDLAEGIWDYGHSHGWVMGEEREPPNTRTVLSSNLISLLAELIYQLGGTGHPERSIPPAYDTSTGYRSHLTLLQIYLRGRMHGAISDYDLRSIQEIAKHMSGNPLVHALFHLYTDGDQSVATELLLSTWPDSRLPTTSDWTEAWRTQRSDGDPGLSPGVGDRTHSGGDFLFAARIVLGR